MSCYHLSSPLCCVVQTRVGLGPHIAGDKATHYITRVAESMAESEGGETQPGKNGGRRKFFFFFFQLVLF